MSEHYVIANRSDGLGARLGAIYNGLLVSELTGVPFKFCWPSSYVQKDKNHAVSSDVSEIFSKRFIDEYYADSAVDAYPLLELDYLPFDVFSEFLKSQFAATSLRVHCTSIFNSIIVDDDCINELKRKVVAKFEFCEGLQNAINLASKVEIPDNLTAIHIRAGDILYGSFSEIYQCYTKVICAPLVKMIIQNSYNKNQYILFGQEPEFARYMKVSGLAIDANGYSNVYGFNAVEQAFFDFSLMARCSNIIAGASAFIWLAEYFGGRLDETVFKIRPKNVWANLIRSELNLNPCIYSSKQIAYSNYVCYQYLYDTAENEILVQHLLNALKYDPKNKLYLVLLLISYYRVEKFADAELELARWLSEQEKSLTDLKKDRSFQRVLLQKTMTGSSVSAFERYKLYVENAVKNGIEFAIYFFERAFDLKETSI
jgi:hypothetical protein